jgi:hypothetical protein
MKYGPNDASCEDCKFSVQPCGLPGIDYNRRPTVIDECAQELGCHRNPPTALYDLKKKVLIGCGWPAVGRDDWCAEHTPR